MRWLNAPPRPLCSPPFPPLTPPRTVVVAAVRAAGLLLVIPGTVGGRRLLSLVVPAGLRVPAAAAATLGIAPTAAASTVPAPAAAVAAPTAIPAAAAAAAVPAAPAAVPAGVIPRLLGEAHVEDAPCPASSVPPHTAAAREVRGAGSKVQRRAHAGQQQQRCLYQAAV